MNNVNANVNSPFPLLESSLLQKLPNRTAPVEESKKMKKSNRRGKQY